MVLGFGATFLAVFPKKATSLDMPPKPVDFIEQTDFQQAWDKYELQQQAKKLKGQWGGQCVIFVRNFLNTTKAVVPSVAKKTQTDSQSPQIGDIIKTNESVYGHVAIVIDYTDTTVTILESNVPMGSERIGTRTLPLTSPKILGYKEIN